MQLTVSRKLKEKIETAKALLRHQIPDGDLEQVLERAVDMDANWGKPLFKIGLARLQKADTAGAIEIMNKVIAVDPNSGEAAQAKALIEQLKKG